MSFSSSFLKVQQIRWSTFSSPFVLKIALTVAEAVTEVFYGHWLGVRYRADRDQSPKTKNCQEKKLIFLLFSRECIDNIGVEFIN